ncbi:MAG: T9SS C-terminal target domain-containing protein [Calditrichaeota bacterium]|nr:MAG: T9SS C-terminal target domain-containing protein [Calditrichota bacterium]
MKSLLLKLILFVMLACPVAGSAPIQADTILYGYKQYTEYRPGSLPVIISAPHGGFLSPASIPDRTYGVMVTDSKTYETAVAISEAFFTRTGAFPHVIVCRLKRTKLDANRSIDEAAQGNAEAEQAWHDYHRFIETAKDSVSRHYGQGFYIDLHGHGHPKQRLELGYLLSVNDLRNGSLNISNIISKSSFRHLASVVPHAFDTLIRGRGSIGSLFDSIGYPSVPSETTPYPLEDDPYFSGGYSTHRHGSANGGVIDGFQLEAWYQGVRDTEENRRRFADALAEVIERFALIQLDWRLTEQPIVKPDTLWPVMKAWVAPNPFTDICTVFYTLPYYVETVKIELYNTSGQRIEAFYPLPGRAGLRSFNLSLADKATGIYFLYITIPGHAPIAVKMIHLP